MHQSAIMRQFHDAYPIEYRMLPDCIYLGLIVDRHLNQTLMEDVGDFDITRVALETLANEKKVVVENDYLRGRIRALKYLLTDTHMFGIGTAKFIEIRAMVKEKMLAKAEEFAKFNDVEKLVYIEQQKDSKDDLVIQTFRSVEVPGNNIRDNDNLFYKYWNNLKNIESAIAETKLIIEKTKKMVDDHLDQTLMEDVADFDIITVALETLANENKVVVENDYLRGRIRALKYLLTDTHKFGIGPAKCREIHKMVREKMLAKAREFAEFNDVDKRTYIKKQKGEEDDLVIKTIRSLKVPGDDVHDCDNLFYTYWCKLKNIESAITESLR